MGWWVSLLTGHLSKRQAWQPPREAWATEGHWLSPEFCIKTYSQRADWGRVGVVQERCTSRREDCCLEKSDKQSSFKNLWEHQGPLRTDTAGRSKRKVAKDLPMDEKERYTGSKLFPLKAILSTSPVCLAHKLRGDVDLHLQQDLAHWAGTIAVTALLNTTLDCPSYVEIEEVEEKGASSPDTRTSSNSDDLLTSKQLWLVNRQIASMSVCGRSCKRSRVC